jgi:hypothetical protein
LDESIDLDVYDSAIKSSYKARTGGSDYRYRVVLQYPEIHHILVQLGNGTRGEIKLRRGESPQRNLVTAYDLCATFLVEQFGEDAERLDEFFTFVWKDVELITIQTEDMRTAFTIFETINDRGVGLDAMDLLKNLLFRQTSDTSTRAQLADDWKELLRNLRDAGESRPIRFLRYYLIATHDFDRVPTAAGVFDWITDDSNKKLLGYRSKPLQFADALVTASKAYGNFLRGLNEDGTENSYLQAINFQRTGVRQHLCLLLSARHLSSSAFDRLCERLQALVFVLAATTVQWNEIEKGLPDWTKSLRAATSKADVEGFIDVYVQPMINGRLEALALKLEDTRTMPARLQRYMLASLTQFVEEQCGKGGGFERYFKEKLTIEHIFPQSTTDDPIGEGAKKWLDYFKPAHDPGYYVYRLGNLALLHETPNSSAGNLPFKPDKLNWYQKSPYDLTRSIAETLKAGKSNRVTKTVNKYQLHPFDEWNPETLEERHQMMVGMVEEYWQVQLPSLP